MDIKKLFDKYRARMSQEAMLKALLYKVIIGFAVTFVFAFVTSFFTEYFDYWYLIAIGVGLVVGDIAALILYYAVFRPDDKKIARRIDSLGLEERLITMAELKDDNSYIAKRQREDAKAQLSKFNVKSIKFSFAKSLIIAAIIVGVLGVSMTTVNALVQNEIMAPIDEIINPPDPMENKVMVLYEVNDELGGWIEGEIEQVVEVGGSTSTVTAVPAEGWMFLYWEEDQIATPQRSETNVLDDDEDGIIIFTAFFEEIQDNEDEGDLPTDEPSDVPQEEQNDTFDPDNPPESDGKGDRFASSNQIEDGETPYQDKFPEYYEEMLDRLQNGQYSDGDSSAMDTFWDILKGGVGDMSDDDGE